MRLGTSHRKMVIPLGMVYLNPLKRGMRIVLLKNVFSGSISEIWWAITDKRDFGVADGDPRLKFLFSLVCLLPIRYGHYQALK